MPAALRVSRRRLLAVLGGAGAAAASGLLGGCRTGQPGGKRRGVGRTAPPAPTSSASPGNVAADATWLTTVLTGEQAAIAAYDAVLDKHPKLRARLGPLRAEHVRHAEALREAGARAQPAGRATPSPSAVRHSTAASTDQRGVRVPRSRAGALRLIRTAEQQAERRAAHACVAATGRHAGLLGSIAASESSHQVVLG